MISLFWVFSSNLQLYFILLLQQYKILFKRQEMEYFRKGEKVPERHKTLIENNLMNINKVKQTLEILSKNYNRTNKDYENIIERLKKLE